MKSFLKNSHKAELSRIALTKSPSNPFLLSLDERRVVIHSDSALDYVANLHQHVVGRERSGSRAAYLKGYETSSLGPSRAALYFLVCQQDLHEAVRAIHQSFFSEKEY